MQFGLFGKIIAKLNCQFRKFIIKFRNFSRVTNKLAKAYTGNEFVRP